MKCKKMTRWLICLATLVLLIGSLGICAMAVGTEPKKVDSCLHVNGFTDMKCNDCSADVVMTLVYGDSTDYYFSIPNIIRPTDGSPSTATILKDYQFNDSVRFFGNLVINEGVTLTGMDNIGIHGSLSGSGTIASNDVIVTMGETFGVTVNSSIQNQGVINSGTFNAEVKNLGSIYGGTFNGTIVNNSNGKILNLKDDDYTFVLGDSFSISNSGNITCEDHIRDASFVCRLCGESCTHENVTNAKCDDCDVEFVASVTIDEEVSYLFSLEDALDAANTAGEGVVTLHRDDMMGNYTSSDPDVDLVIEKDATLKQDNTLEFHGNISGDGTIDGTGRVFLEENASVSGITADLPVFCFDNATIEGGTFNHYVSTNTEINGGTFNGSIDIDLHASVNGGSFKCDVQLDGTINGGIFEKTVINRYGKIYGGSFESTVNNEGTIYGGIFEGVVNNYGDLYGGTFNGTLKNIYEPDVDDGCTTYSIIGVIHNLTADNHTIALGENAVVDIQDGSDLYCEAHIIRNGKCRLCGICKHENVTNAKCDDCDVEFVASVTIGEDISYHQFLANAFNAANQAGEGVVTLYRDEMVVAFTCSDPDIDLVIDKDATLEVFSEFNFHGDISGEGTITGNGDVTMFGGTISGNVTFENAVYNEAGATILGGNFNEYVRANGSSIEGGTYTGIVSIYETATIKGGTYKSYVINEGTILDGTFDGEVRIKGCVKGGTFNAKLIVDESPDFEGGTIPGEIHNLVGDDHTFTLGENFVLLNVYPDALICEDHILKDGICRLCGESCKHENVTDLKCDSCGKDIYASVSAGDKTRNFADILEARSFALQLAETEASVNITILQDIAAEWPGSYQYDNITVVVEEGVTFTVTNYYYVDYAGNITGKGTIVGSADFYVDGDISGPTFDIPLYAYGYIFGGTFKQKVTNDGYIYDGTFEADVDNEGTILGGTFNSNLKNVYIKSDGMSCAGRDLIGEILNLTGDDYTMILGENFTLETMEGSVLTCEDHILKDGICRLCDAEPAYMITDKNGTVTYGEKYIDLDKNLSTTTVKITLLKDQSEEDTSGSFGFSNIQMVTLDLNGHTLVRRICITNTDLTIMDSVGTGNIAKDSGANVSTYGGKLTLDASLDLLGEKEGNSYWTVLNCAEDPAKPGTDLVIPKGILMIDSSGYVINEIANNTTGSFHKHTAKSEVLYDDEGHWNRCTGCNEKLNAQKHSILGIMVANENEHWNTCVNCDVKLNLGGHTGGAANCTTVGSCTTCKQVYQPIDSNNHDFQGGVCSRCQAKDPNFVLPDTCGYVTRLAGSNRLVTSYLVADQLKAQMGVEKFDSVIIASGKTFADALPGSYLAAAKNAPILLTLAKDQYIKQTADYVKANLKAGGTVYILGGESAVPASMDAALAGFKVQRVAGADRFKTNLEILKVGGAKSGDEILVCEGKGYADSLSASATGKPILLVYKKLTAEQKAYLATLKNCTFTIVGGTTAVPENIAKEIEAYGTVTRLAGKDRLDTSILVADKYFKGAATAVVAYGWDFPDGLCGGPLANEIGAPLILAHSKEKLYTFTADKTNLTAGYVLGGDGLLSDIAVKTVFGKCGSDSIKVIK